MSQFLISRLKPFWYRNFRLFYFAHILSLIGRWSHDLARAWIIYELTASAGAMGNVLLAGAIPVLLFMFYGGALVDRADVRKVMMITQSIMCGLAIIFAFWVEFGQIQLWHFIIYAIIEGTVAAFDGPTFQALVVRLVPREDYQQALALNSTIFHTGRVLGPFIAGSLMMIYGPSLIFFLDACTYMVLVFTLWQLDWSPTAKKVSEVAKSSTEQIKEGLVYFFKSPVLLYPILQLILAICFIFPLLLTVLRTYIPIKFGLDAGTYGWVFSFPALGSLFGALTFAIWKPKNPLTSLWVGIPAMVFFLFLIPRANTPFEASMLMAGQGFASYLVMAALTVYLHLEVLDEYRGRLSALIGILFMSIAPLMSFPIGHLSDVLGYEFTIESCAILFFIGSLTLRIFHKTSPRVEKDTIH
ncbi:MAG: MFS transporter [Bdellovibrionaceae bacterium]|nr:MFS transporter [Pseudobdellovibrionaceae bacterium]